MSRLPPDRWLGIAQAAVPWAWPQVVREECVGAVLEQFAKLDAADRLSADAPLAFTIAYCAAVDERRRWTRSRTLNRDHLPLETWFDPGDDGGLDALELVDRLERRIHRLTEREQHVLELRAYDYSDREIGLRIGVGESRVGQIASKALGKLAA